jgi:sporulation protein YlmC with PRC-barrel domain
MRGDGGKTGLLPMSAIAGAQLRNRAGEGLGTICEVMLAPAEGRIAYLVLSFGGVLGVGEKLFAVPWHAVTVDPADNALVVDMSAERLAELPGFDEEAWPTGPDPNWR